MMRMMSGKSSQATMLTLFIIVGYFFSTLHQLNAIHCSNNGQIRVTDGPSPREGRVDMCISGYWYTLCGDYWGVEEARVVCRELGFCTDGGTVVSDEFYLLHYLVGLRRVDCAGNETALRNCSVSSSYCPSSVGAGVNCSATVPSSPTDVQAAGVTNIIVQVTWSPPDLSNCSDIEEYRIDCYPYYGRIEPQYSSSTSVTVDYHIYYENDFLYQCCVSGNNSAGLGPGNCAFTVPPPPRYVRASPIPSSLTSLLVEWVEPEYIYGRLYGYSVRCGTRYEYTARSSTAVNVTGLNMFTTYTCCVIVESRALETSQECVNATTYLEPPSIPMNAAISEVTTASIQLEWSTPLYNDALSYYTIACMRTRDRAEVWLSTAANTSYTENVTDLWPFTNYNCCVFASNQAGEGDRACLTTLTLPVPPTAPMNVTVTEVTTSSVQLEWSSPQYTNGTITNYTIRCAHSGHSMQFGAGTITDLQPFTNYSCCVSANNQAGEGIHSCVNFQTQPAPPTKPEGFVTTSTDISNLTLSWRPPVESYGQAVLFYTLSCVSPLNDSVLVERVANTSVRVRGLVPHTNYTCCVSAVSSVGTGSRVCVSVETTTTDNVQVASKQDILAAAASGGVFGSVLMLLLIVLIMFVTHWIHKKTRKTTTADPVHDFPADVMELKGKTSAHTTGNIQTENTYAANNRTVHSRAYKEEVEIRYQRPVLKSSNTRRVETETGYNGGKTPQAKAETSQQKSQQDEELTYQPLIPSKTYIKLVQSPEYQDLAFETREPRSPQDQSPARAVSSEGQYEPVRRAEETNQYEPLTFGVSPQADSEYQALTNSSHYQNLNFTHS